MLLAARSRVCLQRRLRLAQPALQPVRKHPRPDARSGGAERRRMLHAVVEAAASSVNSRSDGDRGNGSAGRHSGGLSEARARPRRPRRISESQADTKEVAVALARTASFFSNDQAPLSSRTVRYISGIHFPPGIVSPATRRSTGSRIPIAAVVQRRRTFRARRFRRRDPSTASQPGLGILTGKADLNDSDPKAVNPGGVPLFKQGVMVGGVGVAGVPRGGGGVRGVLRSRGRGFRSRLPLPPGVVVINGMALPFVNQTTHACRIRPGIGRRRLLAGSAGQSGRAPEGDLVAPRAPASSADSRRPMSSESSTRRWRRRT